MASLVRNGQILGPLEVADSFPTRLKGLLGRQTLDGGFLIVPAKSVHSFGMKFSIDIAFCDKALRILHVTSLEPNRITRPRFAAHSVLEAKRGAFEHWGIGIGTELDIVT